MTAQLEAYAPVEVLCATIDHLVTVIEKKRSLGQSEVKEVLHALLTIESAIANGRDLFSRKGEK
jgi:hypothetical protein